MHRNKWSSWRVDETYVKVKGKWKYLYRAVDKSGATVDFLLTDRRDLKAAKRFFQKAIGSSGIPQKINIDRSGANKAAIIRPVGLVTSIHLNVATLSHSQSLQHQSHFSEN